MKSNILNFTCKIKSLNSEDSPDELFIFRESAKISHAVKVYWIILCWVPIFFALFFRAVENIPDEEVHIK